MKILLRDDMFVRLLDTHGRVGGELERFLTFIADVDEFGVAPRELCHVRVTLNMEGVELGAAASQLGSLVWGKGEQREFELECRLMVFDMSYIMQSELFQRELYSTMYGDGRWRSSLTRRVQFVGYMELTEVGEDWSRIDGNIELSTSDDGIANANPSDLGFSTTVYEQEDSIVRSELDEVVLDIENGTLSIDEINDVYGDVILSETDTRSELEEKVKDLMVWEWKQLENNTSSALHEGLRELSDNLTTMRSLPIAISIKGHGEDYELVEE